VLRTNLQFAAADKRLATVLVTSPGAGEGKSTVAANLATVLAQSGRRTLLVDADLRRPRQHKLFGRRKKPGLTDAVMLGCPLEQALSRIDADAGATDVAQGHSADMDVLFAGTTPPSPVDFLNSGTFGTFLERVAKDYDCVVVDTPPALVSADSAVLAARVDGVVLVSRMGKTDWRALAEARKLLIQAGARVLGVVANELVQRRGYGYYRYKYRYYHYRYGPAAAQ
jgi:capsular exopolysaccharide synthesis family protein